MNRVVHFEIPTDHPEASLKFYGEVFGWQFQQFGTDCYWLVTTGAETEPGINGAIMQKKHPHQPVANSIQVNNIDEAVGAIEGHGGVIVVPKMPVPGVGWLAYFKDPDQNIFGIWQDDRTAK